MAGRVTLLALPLWMSGCATSTPYPLGIEGRSQVSIAMAPVSMSAPVSKLSDIHNSGEADSANEAFRFRQELATIRSATEASIKAWLDKQQDFRVLDEPKPEPPAMELKQARQQGDDLVLAVDISGYGHIKRKWIALLFGSGVIEGVTQGVAVSDATGNPALGLGVGAEELASEGLTWIGGSWFWSKYFSPVTIEGRMWRVSDGRQIWHDIRYADNSDEIWKLLSGKKLLKKEQALTASLHEAEKDLLGDLGRYVQNQILFHQHHHTRPLA